MDPSHSMSLPPVKYCRHDGSMVLFGMNGASPNQF